MYTKVSGIGQDIHVDYVIKNVGTLEDLDKEVLQIQQNMRLNQTLKTSIIPPNIG